MSHRRSLLLCSALLVPAAACGDPAPDAGPDAGDPAADGAPGSAVALDRCAEDGVALEVAWNVDNLHPDTVAMTLLPDGTVVLASADGAVKQWSIGTSADAAPLPGGRPAYGEPLTDVGTAVRALGASADGARVLGGDAAGALRQWTVSDAGALPARSLGAAPLTAVAGVPGGGIAVADDSFGGAMRVVAPDDAGGDGGDVLQTALWGVTTLLADGDDLFTAGHDYGMAAVERRHAAFPHEPADAWDTLATPGWVRALARSTDGRLAVGGDGYVVVLAADDLAAGPVAEVAAGARAVAWTASGAHLAVAADGRVALWDRELTREVAGLDLAEGAGPVALAVDASGERLIVATADGRLRALVCR